MTPAMLEHTLGNTLLALPLAAIAWLLGRTGRHPSITHFAWVLVMLRLVMPPVMPPVMAPVMAAPWLSVPLPIMTSAIAPQASPSDHLTMSPEPSVFETSTGTSGAAANPADNPADKAAATEAIASGSASAFSAAGSQPPNAAAAEASPKGSNYGLLIGLFWLTGTALLVAVSGWRLYRFQRLVQASTSPADSRIVRLAERAAADLGMPLRVRLLQIQANIPPFVWRLSGQPSVVLPQSLVDSLTDTETTLVLMHELAHLRRRDHLVRWLDWAVIAWLWWNPIAWVARFGLRSAEEPACDALVLRHCRALPRVYGHCLVTVSERLHRPAIRTPVQTCTMGDGGPLEQRIRLIMSDTLAAKPSIALRSFLVAAACVSLGVGFTFAPPADADAAAAADQSAGHTRTIAASIDGATSLAVTALNGSIKVVRDDSATAMSITAIVHARERNGWGGSMSEQQRLMNGARLLASKDTKGRASIEVKFPGSPSNPPTVSITVSTAALESVEAATVNGTIAIDGELGEIETETVNGTIDVSGAQSKVEAESVNGTIAVALAPGATGSITAEATNGRITLQLPPAGDRAWNGTVVASSTNGSITAKGMTGRISRTWTGEDFEGAVGSGSPATARLSVTNGSIRIRQP